MSRILIDTLEKRVLLTAYVVNTLSDTAADMSGTSDGSLSLREAIIASNTNATFGDAGAGNSNGDTITFSSEFAGRTLTLGQGQLPITDDLTITGDITIDGNDASRIFNITSAGNVTLNDLTLTDGRDGGAVGGGAIYTENTSLTIDDATLAGNRADGAAGSGGGIFQRSGTVRITDTRISGNLANRAGGGIEIDTGSLTLERVQLGGTPSEILSDGSGNIATGEGAAAGNGGGLHVTGAARVDVIGGTVRGNTAGLEGGGLWNSATGTMRVLGGVVVSENDADGPAADDGGGGVFNNGGRLIVELSTLRDNTALGTAGSGGGLFSVAGDVTVTRSTIADNTANRAGGGVEIIAGTIRFTGSTLEGNSVSESTAMPGNGGALHSTGAAAVTVDRGLVKDNTAASEGGGLWNSATGTLTVSDTLITGNAARGADATNGGGGIYNDGGNVSVADTTIEENTALGLAGSGGGILSVDGDVAVTRSNVRENVANRAGGGIELVDGSLSYRFSTLNSNVAGPEGSALPGNGGGLHTTGTASVSFFKSVADDNVAALEGGGLWLAAGGRLDMQGSSFRGNDAQGDAANDGGGALFNNGGVMYVTFTTLFENTASGTAGSGGAVLSAAGTTSLNRLTIRDNDANRAGGGVEVIAGRTELNTVVLRDNDVGNAPGNGGGLHVTGPDADTLISRSFVQNNTAASEGGGLWNDAGSTMRVEGTSIFDNVASGAAIDNGGGGLFNNGGELTVVTTRIGGNTANGTRGNGGGIHLAAGGTATFTDVRISDNRAFYNGGGIFNDGRLTANDSSVFFNRARVGGGIFTDSGATTDLNDTSVRLNRPDNLAGPGTVS